MPDDVSKIEQELAEFGVRNAQVRKSQAELDAQRDPLVTKALLARVSKNRIYTLTGISRSTLYKLEERLGLTGSDSD